MLSVIIPIYNERKYISSCIDSVLAQDYPLSDIELLLVDGMSNDGTRDIIQQYIDKYDFIRLLDNPKRYVPSAMNIGIMSSTGEIIIRLDAHAIFPNNYFFELVLNLKTLGADNVGGVCQTLPLRNTVVCKSIAAVLSSRFGMGDSQFRMGAKHVMNVDTVPFGCFHRELFDKIGFFDETLIRNQDDEFNGRIIKNGGKIYLLPQLIIRYYSRDTIKKVSRMFYQYGLYKPLVNMRLGSPATLRQFFPPLFVCGLIVGFCLCFVSQWIKKVYIAILSVYILLAICFSLKTSQNPKQVIVQSVIYFIVHLSYGVGYLVGLFKLVFHYPLEAKSNR